jgi:hypothetical protein
VVGIVVAVLLIGLAVAVTGMIQTVYVPQWMKQKEAGHMQEVSSQFVQLKYALDIQSLVGENSAISTYINLGSEGIPIFSSGRTFDSLEILSNSCNITISNSTDSITFLLGSIKYSSGNSYYVDQSFIFEAGALILNQLSNSILTGKPYLSVSNFTNLSLTIINILKIDGKEFAYGQGTYAIYTEFLDSTNYVIYDFENITVTTNYPDVWNVIFNSSTLKYSGFTYVINKTDDQVSAEFSGSLGNLFLKVGEISAQVATGWVE